jgi:chromosome segregation ATPase
MKINLNDESNLAFTYSQLNPEQRELALNAAIEIKARERTIWENILAIGNKLIEVKQALGHGYFTDWIQKEFEWHETYARKYMKIAEELGKAKRDDRLVLPNSLTALYQLAAGLSDSESEEEKTALIGRVEQETESKGKALTEAEIKKIRAEIESEFRSKQETLFDELRQTQLQVTDAYYKVECATRQQVAAESENKKLKEYKRYYEETYQQKKLIEGDLRNTKDELSKLNKKIERLAQEMETEKNKAVKEYVAKNSAQLQQQREELQQSLEYMNQEHHELQLKIDHLKTEYDHVHDLNSHRQGLRNLMSLFQEINQQQSLLLNPPADMMEEYKLLIKQFRLWADVMEDVISEEKNQPIIEVSTKVKS